MAAIVEMRIRQEIVLGIGGYRALEGAGAGADRVSHERGPLGVSGAGAMCGTDGDGIAMSFAEARELASPAWCSRRTRR